MNKLINQAFCGLLLIVSLSVQADDVTIKDAWVRAAPPNAPALAAFMQVTNHSAKTLSIVDVRTSLAVDHIELHRTQMKEGVMKMIPHKVIPVPANSMTILKPGSWHIMLIKPVKVPAPGDMVELTLVFDNGVEKTVHAPVRKGKKMMMGSDHS